MAVRMPVLLTNRVEREILVVKKTTLNTEIFDAVRHFITGSRRFT